MTIKSLFILHLASIIITAKGRSIENTLTLRELDIKNSKASQIKFNHIIEKRDEQNAIVYENVNEIKAGASVANNEASQYLQSYIGEGNTAFENIAAGETLEDVKKLGEDYVSNLENLQDDVSQNLNKFGDEASKNVEKIGEEVNKHVEKYGKEAMENFNKMQEEAGETLNELSKNFEGTANDLSNFANKKGQESINDAQQWFKDNTPLLIGIISAVIIGLLLMVCCCCCLCPSMFLCGCKQCLNCSCCCPSRNLCCCCCHMYTRAGTSDGYYV